MTRRWPTILWRQVGRHAWRHKLLTALNVLSVALGVCVFLAIMIANQSANRSFRAGVELLAGKANLEVRGPFDETLVPAVAAVPGVAAATPVVEGLLTLPDHPGEYLRLLGVDPFTNPPFETFRMLRPDGEAVDVEVWLRERDSIALTREFAEKLKISPGDTLRVGVNGRIAPLTVRFILQPDDPATLSDIRSASMDIGWAQELLGMVGRVSSLQILVRDEADAAKVTRAIRALVPGDVAVAAPAQRSEQIGRMLSSFQLNLTALSLVSLLVGMFLIYNTVSASVVRGRREIGILRAVGTSRAEIRLLYLVEALFLGAPGVALGILAAFPLAAVLVGAVSETVTSLYVLVSIERLEVSADQVLLAAFAGLASVVVAAWVPSGEATKVQVTRALHLGTAREHFVTVPRRWLVWGLGLLLLAFVSSWLALHTGPALLGFAAAFFVITGFAFLVPTATTAAGFMASVLAERCPGGSAWRLASRNLVRAMHRNAVTIAALMAAVAMTVGVSVMIFSFRGSVDTWINRTIQADLFVTPAANETTGFNTTLPDHLLGWLEQHPETQSVDTFFEKRMTFRGEVVFLGVIRGRNQGELDFLGGDDEAKSELLRQADHVAVSESFARRHGVDAGGTIELATPGGPRDFRIAGVYLDYTRDQGVILIDRNNYAAHWPAPGAHSAAVHLRNPAASEAMAAELRETFGREGEYAIYSNASLRQRIFQIFDQTFAVTYVLRSISVLVAVLGVSLTLTTLVTEREREIGILRAIGASARQVRRALVAESALIGLVAGVVGVAAGACLAMVLTWVVNLAFFGWTVQLCYPWDLLAWTPVWMLAAAAVAGLLPAARAARIAPAAALRSE
jgi:putative ABC transport system permease protein